MDKSEQDMKTLVFDVMLDGRFIHTFRYQYCPLFPIDEEELEKFVTDSLPTLNGKDFEILFLYETDVRISSKRKDPG